MNINTRTGQFENDNRGYWTVARDPTNLTGKLKLRELCVASKTHDFASIADGANASTTITLTGAKVGDVVLSALLSAGQVAGLFTSGYVSAADTITFVVHNESGGAVDLASQTISAVVACVA